MTVISPSDYRGILTSFSWLAVHSLVQAADVSSLPVRLGIPKPLGASSVVTDYQAPRSYGSSYRMHRQAEDPHHSLARQMHVRSALESTLDEASSTSSTSLPHDGVVLKPQLANTTVGGSGGAGVRGEGRGESGVGGAAKIGGTGGVVSEMDSDSDFSDQEDDNIGARSSTSAGLTVPQISNGVLPYELEFMNVQDLPAGIVLDLDPTSSDEDFEYDDVIAPRVSVGLGRETIDDDVDDIYPFAWALDGRRIADGSPSHTRAETPTSFVSGMIVCVCVVLGLHTG